MMAQQPRADDVAHAGEQAEPPKDSRKMILTAQRGLPDNSAGRHITDPRGLSRRLSRLPVCGLPADGPARPLIGDEDFIIRHRETRIEGGWVRAGQNTSVPRHGGAVHSSKALASATGSAPVPPESQTAGCCRTASLGPRDKRHPGLELAVGGGVSEGGVEIGSNRYVPTGDKVAQVAKQVAAHRIDGPMMASRSAGGGCERTATASAATPERFSDR